MALNLKTLGVRSLTAAVFVVVLLGCILLGYTTFTILFFLISMGGLFEFFRITRKLSAHPYVISGFAAGVFIYVCFVIRNSVLFPPHYGKITLFIVVLPFFLMAVALFSNKPNALTNVLYTLGGLIYAVLPFALLHEIVISANDAGQLIYSPETLLGIIFLIWINDTFAYLGGSMFGKHKMMPSVSPGKSWEGTVTGIICSFAVSFLFAHYFEGRPPLLWPLLGLVVPVLSTIGDLVQSQIKRLADIKDSGKIMPGHGGILDRFDSLIFVTPFVLVIVKFL